MMQRKAQLDALLVDSQRYDAKKQEVESWLARMEARMDRMGPVGHTADVLEAQLREQKVRVKSRNAWRPHLYATGVAYKFKLLHKSPICRRPPLKWMGQVGKIFCSAAEQLLLLGGIHGAFPQWRAKGLGM